MRGNEPPTGRSPLRWNSSMDCAPPRLFGDNPKSDTDAFTGRDMPDTPANSSAGMPCGSEPTPVQHMMLHQTFASQAEDQLQTQNACERLSGMPCGSERTPVQYTLLHQKFACQARDHLKDALLGLACKCERLGCLEDALPILSGRLTDPVPLYQHPANKGSLAKTKRTCLQ